MPGTTHVQEDNSRKTPEQLRIEQIDRELAELLPILEREEAKVDYSKYVVYAHHGKYVHGKHTRLICDKLQRVEEGKIKRLMIFLPPGHSKSHTVTETFPSWFIGRNPERKVIQVSYGDDLAWDFGAKNRDKIVEFGKKLWDIEIAPDKIAKSDWGIKGHSGYMRSGGILTSITGKRANLLVIDDVHKNREEADSAIIRERIWKEFTDTLETRETPDMAIIVIMTRWHVDDLAGRILARDGKEAWDIVNLPCEAEENDILGRAVGEPLWPEYGYDKAWMESKKKKAPARTWNSLYQQRPTIEGGNLILATDFQYYTQRPTDFEQEIHSWDMTFKDNKDNDFVSGGAWGIKDGKIYLLDRVKERMDFNKSLLAVEDLTKKWPKAGIKLIEDKANGPAIISALRFKVGGITAITPKGSKYARAEAVTPLFRARRIYLPSTSLAPWVEDYVKELTEFPNGEHDDDVDMTSQLLERFLYLLDIEVPEVRTETCYDFDDDNECRQVANSFYD